MLPIVVAMVVTLALAVGIAGLVVLGIAGRGRRRAPKLADTMSKAASHLNGDAEPPERLVRVFESSR